MAEKKTASKKVEANNEETVKVEQPITPTVDASPEVTEKSVDTNPETKDEPSIEAQSEPVVSKSVSEKSVKELADEVEAGVHGSGRERMLVLGTRYFEVQQEVNKRFIKRGRK